MAENAPGQHYRKGISLIEAVKKFGGDASAEAWFVERRWPDGIQCIQCDSKRIATRKPNARRKTPVYHCNDCKKDFTVKTGTIMHDSRLPLSKWAMAFYLFSTNLKGVSSMKLHRDLGITQKSAWHLAHRIRETWNDADEKFAGEVEVDETYIGGKEGNKHAHKKLHAGRGTVGKTAVVGMRDRDTGDVKAQVVESTDRATLHEFVAENTAPDTIVYTDEARAYIGMPREHGAVKHSVGEYVNGQIYTNGVESFWSMLKRGYMGTYHHMSDKHLQRYVNEFAGRHNSRPLDTRHQMAAVVRNAVGKRLQYKDLIA